jgi:HAD superfamily hydrolase (TIGR01509 family)
MRTIATLLLFYCFWNMAAATAVNSSSQIKVVVFDFGGVIGTFDSSQIDRFLAQQLHVSDQQAEEIYRQMNAALTQGQGIDEFWQSYFRQMENHLPPEWIRRFTTMFAHSLYLEPGTLEVVKELQAAGYQTALLSNTTSFHASILHRLGYYAPFHPLLLSYQIGAEKPQPEAYRILLRCLALPPSQVAFVDNTPANVEEADRLGIHGIHFTTAARLRQQLAELGIRLSQPAAAMNYCLPF